MNCQDYDHDLGDYVDGALEPAARDAFEAHLKTCAGCRATVTDFQTIRFAALALEPQTPPPAVWPLLAARLEDETRSWWRMRSGTTVWQPAAAVAMAVLLTTSLTWIGARLEPAGDTARMASSSPAVRPLANVALDAAEKDYATAIAGLEQIASAERDALDPSTADVLQVNLTVIDTAIGESRAALESEPENGLAIESLFEALRRKLALLQDAVALINEMRKGNRVGAARIVSGLDQ